MTWNVLLTAVLAVGLVGCATTQRKTDSAQQLEMRVSELEKAVQEKDSAIRSLESQLDSVRRMEQVERPEVFTKTTLDLSQVSKKQIQTALKNAGYYSGPIDGKFGQMTSSAVREFQKANNLKEDGKVGQQTWTKLGEYL